MAKQDDASETARQGQSEREATSGFRDFRQAGREAESAARSTQSGMAEFMSSLMTRPYVDLLRDSEGITRQWTQGIRSSIEQTLDIAAKMNETAINEMRRAADFYLQICETGALLQRSMVGEAQVQAQRQTRQTARAQAAE